MGRSQEKAEEKSRTSKIASRRWPEALSLLDGEGGISKQSTAIFRQTKKKRRSAPQPGEHGKRESAIAQDVSRRSGRRPLRLR